MDRGAHFAFQEEGFDETMTHVGGLISSSTRDNLNVNYIYFLEVCSVSDELLPFLISRLE